MIEIRTATAAVTAAQRLLDAGTSAGSRDFWRSYAVTPLAAVLLSTAHANFGFADLATVRDVLASALHRAADLAPRQRDSVCIGALAAFARS